MTILIFRVYEVLFIRIARWNHKNAHRAEARSSEGWVFKWDSKSQVLYLDRSWGLFCRLHTSFSFCVRTNEPFYHGGWGEAVGKCVMLFWSLASITDFSKALNAAFCLQMSVLYGFQSTLKALFTKKSWMNIPGSKKLYLNEFTLPFLCWYFQSMHENSQTAN